MVQNIGFVTTRNALVPSVTGVLNRNKKGIRQLVSHSTQEKDRVLTLLQLQVLHIHLPHAYPDTMPSTAHKHASPAQELCTAHST